MPVCVYIVLMLACAPNERESSLNRIMISKVYILEEKDGRIAIYLPAKIIYQTNSVLYNSGFAVLYIVQCTKILCDYVHTGLTVRRCRQQ